LRPFLRGGIGFDSPLLHQPVAPDWQDAPGFGKARQFRSLAGRGRVSRGGWTVSWRIRPPVSPKVSGRKIPFPRMQFARVGLDESLTKERPALVPPLGRFGG
jgi:hypothetical protein